MNSAYDAEDFLSAPSAAELEFIAHSIDRLKTAKSRNERNRVAAETMEDCDFLAQERQVTLPDGRLVRLKHQVRAAIPRTGREAELAEWLAEQGHDSDANLRSLRKSGVDLPKDLTVVLDNWKLEVSPPK